jgi:hypothetical protein
MEASSKFDGKFAIRAAIYIKDTGIHIKICAKEIANREVLISIESKKMSKATPMTTWGTIKGATDTISNMILPKNRKRMTASAPIVPRMVAIVEETTPTITLFPTDLTN